MNLLLGGLLVVGALLTAFVAATTFSLRSSDPAGNALAQVYLVVTVILLWVLIGIMLLIAATRPPRQGATGGVSTLVTVLLYLGAGAGALAGLYALTGHRAEGVYQLLVQLAVILAPLAALGHIAWRGFGLGIPAFLGTSLTAVLVVVASVAPLPGLFRKAPRPVVAADPVDQLAFPVIVLHNLSSLVVADSAADLRTMHSNHIVMAKSEPFLIDSRLQIFVLRDLKLDRGMGRLMLTGQGLEPVSFRLVDWEPDGTPEAAREILLRSRWFSADSDHDAAIRRQLAGASTLGEMIRIIEAPAPPSP